MLDDVTVADLDAVEGMAETVYEQSVAFHGFDWDSLAPMRVPPCDPLERSASIS